MPKYSNNESFRIWLSDELKHRNLSLSDLARRSNITRSHISRILSGDRTPGMNTLVAIARALSLPEEDMLRHAGMLAIKNNEIEGESELIELYKKMNTDNRHKILGISRLFVDDCQQDNK